MTSPITTVLLVFALGAAVLNWEIEFVAAAAAAFVNELLILWASRGVVVDGDA